MEQPQEQTLPSGGAGALWGWQELGEGRDLAWLLAAGRREVTGDQSGTP